jgi:hypothetical protein
VWQRRWPNSGTYGVVIMGLLGFNTAPSGGADFIPIVKYDAKSGQLKRVDRVADTDGKFTNEDVYITKEFKALFDLDNAETGWSLFDPGRAPSWAMVPIATVDKTGLPPQPSDKHKNAVRFTIKLANSCGGDRPIRELAGNSSAFTSAFEELYDQYLKERGQYPGMLPAIVLEKTLAQKGAHGTNYKPVWKIIGWAPRGDLKPLPRQAQPATNGQAQATNGAAPSTGAQRVAPPQQATQTVSADDFG